MIGAGWEIQTCSVGSLLPLWNAFHSSWWQRDSNFRQCKEIHSNKWVTIDGLILSLLWHFEMNRQNTASSKHTPWRCIPRVVCGRGGFLCGFVAAKSKLWGLGGFSKNHTQQLSSLSVTLAKAPRAASLWWAVPSSLLGTKLQRKTQEFIGFPNHQSLKGLSFLSAPSLLVLSSFAMWLWGWKTSIASKPLAIHVVWVALCWPEEVVSNRNTPFPLGPLPKH